jgi:hypothetical protein
MLSGRMRFRAIRPGIMGLFLTHYRTAAPRGG